MINRLKSLSPQFKKILKVSSRLAGRLGYRIYLVGGVTRDLLLGRRVLDLDIVVEGDAIKFTQKLAECIQGDFSKHHAFGTATVYFDGHKIDFATARTEKYPHWGALPKVKPSSLAQDLKRRDFTINAMAISLNRPDYGKLIDLYNGSGDLRKRLIRVLHAKSFLEDPTRILRAIRFEQRFGFRMEPCTFSLLKKALKLNMLGQVNPHRLRDELILILKEAKPYRYIKRIRELEGFSFVRKEISFSKRKLRFFRRAQASLSRYARNFKKHRKLEAWLIYLGGLVVDLPLGRVEKFLHDFGFKKGERIIISSIRRNLSKIKKLDKRVRPHVVYRILTLYSFESILFFHAYHSRGKLRKNIEYFLNTLVNIRLKTRGKDLKKLDFGPLTIYSKILTRLLYAKIDKGLKSKKEELAEAGRIYKRLS